MSMDSMPPSETPPTKQAQVAFGGDVKVKTPELPATEPVRDVSILPSMPSPLAIPEDTVDTSLASYITTELTPTQKEALNKCGDKLRTGPSNAVPMLCRGLACPYVQVCPLHMNGVPLPEGKICPVEQAAVDSWRRDFITAANIPDDHPNRMLIGLLVDDIAATVAYQARIGWANAIEPEIFRDEVIGISDNGEPIVAKRLNPSIDLSNRTMGNKLKMLRELLATPRAEVEAKRKIGIDPSSQAAASMAKLNRLKNQGGQPVIQAAFVRVDLKPDAE